MASLGPLLQKEGAKTSNRGPCSSLHRASWSLQWSEGWPAGQAGPQRGFDGLPPLLALCGMGRQLLRRQACSGLLRLAAHVLPPDARACGFS